MDKKISLFDGLYWRSLGADLLNIMKKVPFLFFCSFVIAIIPPTFIYFANGSGGAQTPLLPLILLAILYFFGTNILLAAGALRTSGGQFEGSYFAHIFYGTPTNKNIKLGYFYFILKGFVVLMKYMFSPFLFIISLVMYLGEMNKIRNEMDRESLK